MTIQFNRSPEVGYLLQTACMFVRMVNNTKLNTPQKVTPTLENSLELFNQTLYHNCIIVITKLEAEFIYAYFDTTLGVISAEFLKLCPLA